MAIQDEVSTTESVARDVDTSERPTNSRDRSYFENEHRSERINTLSVDPDYPVNTREIAAALHVVAQGDYISKDEVFPALDELNQRQIEELLVESRYWQARQERLSQADDFTPAAIDDSKSEAKRWKEITDALENVHEKNEHAFAKEQIELLTEEARSPQAYAEIIAERQGDAEWADRDDIYDNVLPGEHNAANSLPRSVAQVDELNEWGEPALSPESQADRERTHETVEKTTKGGAPLRFETSTRTAEYQPDTNTVDFTNKTTSTKSELIPGQGLTGSPESAEAVRSRTEEVFGAKIDRDEFDNSDQPLEIADREADRRASLQRATELASHELKTEAQVTLANKDDGIYNGKVLGVTDKYLLQRSGPGTAVAHEKDIFANLPGYGRDVNVLYSGGQARVSQQPLKDKALGIER